MSGYPVLEKCISEIDQIVGPAFCKLFIAALVVQVGVTRAEPQRNASETVRQAGRFHDAGSTATNVADGFTMIAVGDLMVRRPWTKGQDSGFSAIVEILRDVDVTFRNLETNIFDMREFKGSPQAASGGGYLVGVPDVAPDLKAMGFNLLGRANNHALDWGVEGMRETSRVLDQSGIIHAGIGESLAQAGAARFLETARGRVALVSFASTFTPLSRAADLAGEVPGRPGINALRLKKSIVVPPEMLESLRRIRNALPDTMLGALPDFTFDGEDQNRVVLDGVTYTIGDKVGYRHTRCRRHSKKYSPRQAVRRLPDRYKPRHEPGNWSQEPPDYAQSFAHRVIEAGADAYVVHGPHQLRGIEIYKGRPIFYSVGNFISDNLQTTEGADMFVAYR
ncbi:poly-gamma-glutamate capsule biosynthesis protein CapA/YwtB (metallophosphatase superfamily) [Bradyrhizobium yuanmingense]